MCSAQLATQYSVSENHPTPCLKGETCQSEYVNGKTKYKGDNSQMIKTFFTATALMALPASRGYGRNNISSGGAVANIYNDRCRD